MLTPSKRNSPTRYKYAMGVRRRRKFRVFWFYTMTNTNTKKTISTPGFVVFGWMREYLQLPLDELCVFAIVHGYTRNGSYFIHRPKYINKALGISESEAEAILFRLEDKGFIRGYRSEDKTVLVWRTATRILHRVEIEGID